MSTISNIGKVAYVYNQATDTWHPVAGVSDSSADYTWTGDHVFATSGSVSIGGPAVASAGINNFATATERNTKIPSPVNGTLVAVVVNGVLQLQYYYNGSWRLHTDNAYLEEKTSSFTLAITDSGKTLDVNSSSTITVTVPPESAVNFPIGTQMAFIQAGAGQVAFVPGTDGTNTVSILSKNSNRKISARYSQAILIKKAANTWYLMGDLTA